MIDQNQHLTENLQDLHKARPCYWLSVLQVVVPALQCELSSRSECFARFPEARFEVHEYRSGSNCLASRVRGLHGFDDGTRVPLGRSCRGSQVWLHRSSLHQKSWSLSASCYINGIKALHAVTSTQLSFSHWTWYEVSIASPADEGHRQGAERQSYTYGMLCETSWEM